MDADKGSAGWADCNHDICHHGNAESAWRATRDLRLTFSVQALADDGSLYFVTPSVRGAIDDRVRSNDYNVDDAPSSHWPRR